MCVFSFRLLGNIKTNLICTSQGQGIDHLKIEIFFMNLKLLKRLIVLHYIIVQQHALIRNPYKRFPVWLPNRLISAGLEPVFSHTEKLYRVSYYSNIKSNFVSGPRG